MKLVHSLLLASTASAINIKATPLAGHAPDENTCVYVNQKTGIEQACDAIGNSAWEPDAPLEDPADLGWSNGFEALYWFSSVGCKDGCKAGDASLVTVNDEINFTNNGDFMK